ncbi:MAG: hypothetical protein ABR540_04760 [Acidimicrobiales bacterium]
MPAVNGAVVVLVVSDGFTAADPLGFVGTVVVVAVICWSTASDGLDPPLPVGTVVVGAAVAVAGAAVVGVVAGATVVTGLAVVASLVAALLLEVPWDWVPAAVGAGAVSAEAGPAFSTRKRPARSAKDATHLRGLTASFLVLELIGLNRPPSLGCGRGGRRPSAGTREVNHDADGVPRHLWPPDLRFFGCWRVLEATNGSRWNAVPT